MTLAEWPENKGVCDGIYFLIPGRNCFSRSLPRSETTDSSYPSVCTAVQEQIGLKLEPQKVPLEMLVIDHPEGGATEN